MPGFVDPGTEQRGANNEATPAQALDPINSKGLRPGFFFPTWVRFSYILMGSVGNYIPDTVPS